MSNLKKLQKWLINNNIDIFIVSRTDEFLSENISPYAERLNWISNFSGSSGKAIVMQNLAGIFVDGRYTIQVQEQVDKNDFAIKHLNEFNGWLKKNLQKNIIIGLDPNLHSKTDIEGIKTLKSDQITAVSQRIIDVNRELQQKENATFLSPFMKRMVAGVS